MAAAGRGAGSRQSGIWCHTVAGEGMLLAGTVLSDAAWAAA